MSRWLARMLLGAMASSLASGADWQRRKSDSFRTCQTTNYHNPDPLWPVKPYWVMTVTANRMDGEAYWESFRASLRGVVVEPNGIEAARDGEFKCVDKAIAMHLIYRKGRSKVLRTVPTCVDEYGVDLSAMIRDWLARAESEAAWMAIRLPEIAKPAGISMDGLRREAKWLAKCLADLTGADGSVAGLGVRTAP